MKDISATKKGLIIGGLLIALSACLFYVFKLPENGSNQYAVLLLFIAGVIWALLDYKRKAPATAGFKDYFNEGFSNIHCRYPTDGFIYICVLQTQSADTRKCY